LAPTCYGTGIFNLLDVPAATLPVTRVTVDDLATMAVECPSSVWRDPLQYGMHRATMEGSLGMPVSVQLVAMPFREETCVELMRIVESTAQF